MKWQNLLYKIKISRIANNFEKENKIGEYYLISRLYYNATNIYALEQEIPEIYGQNILRKVWIV